MNHIVTGGFGFEEQAEAYSRTQGRSLHPSFAVQKKAHSFWEQAGEKGCFVSDYIICKNRANL
jgi:hypothetical protein